VVVEATLAEWRLAWPLVEVVEAKGLEERTKAM
jgi:hypothetical protein